MDTIQSVIERFTYYNEENGYSVAKLEEGIVAVGMLPGVNVGETVKLTGHWISHPQYGRQFKFESFSTIYPATISGITKYLGSGLIKGIGPVTATRIADFFKEKTLDIIENDVEKLIEVEGVGKKRVDMIAKGWEEQKAIKDIMIFLQSHNISNTYAIKIYKKYGDKSNKVVKENPYQLTYDIWGIGFKTADKIGKSLGYEDQNPVRVKAGILYVLNEASDDGHVYLPQSELVKRCNTILNVDLNESSPILEEMVSEDLIIKKNEKIYLPPFYYAEVGITNKVKSLSLENKDISSLRIKSLRIKKGYFSEEQLEAIRKSLKYRISILTGGPGTGKTTTLIGIVDIHKQLKNKIMLAAPTGRAAKRMNEVIGFEAKTIHRLLEYKPSNNQFIYNNENPLQTDLLVIDEVSMIDTILMNNLLKAVSAKTILILVGDVDQLPSVGAGNILRDMIGSEIIPVTNLSKIFRQAEKSQIIVTAHRINKGLFPDITSGRDSDFFFIEEEDNEQIPPMILDLCKRRLPKKYGFNHVKDIQVLTPMYRGDTGANNLNNLLQEELNQNDIVFQRGGRHYKKNDKVMQLRNNYNKEVFNGDLGFIHRVIIENQVMEINFNDRIVEYDFSELDEITLAYAVSVHKSQGSEYPCVILPLTTSHYMMLQRNLLYTAITRASQLMVIIGTKKALAIAIKNNKVQKRYTSLFKHGKE